MIQLIDKSHQILYQDTKAEGVLATLISATVSHELRNPLSSLIGQIASMDQCFEYFEKLISQIRNENPEVSKMLEDIFYSFHIVGQKITSGVKLIDLFVHDILDYSSLNKGKLHLEKNIEIFDVKQAVNEIIDIQHDKCVIKQIDLKTQFHGFNENEFLIKTDKKRLQ